MTINEYLQKYDGLDFSKDHTISEIVSDLTCSFLDAISEDSPDTYEELEFYANSLLNSFLYKIKDELLFTEINNDQLKLIRKKFKEKGLNPIIKVQFPEKWNELEKERIQNIKFKQEQEKSHREFKRKQQEAEEKRKREEQERNRFNNVNWENLFENFANQYSQYYQHRQKRQDDFFNQFQNFGSRSNSNQTCFQKLGLTSSATESEVKSAYRKLSMEHHPDRPTGNQAKFVEITNAKNECLKILQRK